MAAQSSGKRGRLTFIVSALVCVLKSSELVLDMLTVQVLFKLKGASLLPALGRNEEEEFITLFFILDCRDSYRIVAFCCVAFGTAAVNLSLDLGLLEVVRFILSPKSPLHGCRQVDKLPAVTLYF